MSRKLEVNFKFTKNIATRSEILHGVEYIIAPVVMIREGVLPGSAGPILYTSSEIEASVNFWNGVPVTINHPLDSDGNHVSARSPGIVEEFGVGQIYNTQFDTTTNSLKAEAYINKVILEEKFPVVYAAILDDNINMDVSTGVFFDDRGEPGNFNGVSYNSVAYGCSGDHLALLPNDTGACSWVDGCGLRANSSTKKEKHPVFNELSHEDTERALWRHVDSLDDNSYIYYVDAIYDGFFTFRRAERDGERKRTLWKQNYSKTNDIITPNGTPQRVTETRVYTVVSEGAESPSGTPTTTNQTNEESEMANDKACCPEKVKSLIAAKTNAFTQDDEEMLLTLNEKQLESTTAMSEKLLTANSKTDTNTDTGGEILQTTEEFLKDAPEHIQVKFNGLLKKEADEKDLIIENMLKDENCTFNKEELGVYEVDVLKKMAGLAKKEPETTNESLKTDMTGNLGTQTQTEIPGDQETLTEEQLLTPVKLNWKKE